MKNSLKRFLYVPPLRTGFSVQTDDDDLAHQLKIQYGQDLQPESTPQPCKAVSFLREDGRYRVTFDGEDWLTDDPLHAFSSIVFDHTEYAPSVLALHGAAVECRGRAYLFLAHTTGGKTTLSAYLTACGFGYITDDCILLDRETFTVHPCVKPLHLRRGGLTVLQKLGIDPACESIFAPPNERYVYTPASAVTAPLPLGEIFFIHRTDAENRMEELPKNQRLEMLLKSPITPYSVSGDYLRLLLRLADHGCRVLHYCDMAFVRDTVNHSALQNLT